ncbi:MAG: hypothetical protein ABJI96_08920 [Paracoccaceae bacterium]
MPSVWLGRVRTWGLTALLGATIALSFGPVVALDLTAPPALSLYEFRQSLETLGSDDGAVPTFVPKDTCAATDDSVQASALRLTILKENNLEPESAIDLSGIQILGDLDLSEIEFRRPLQIEDATLCGRLVMWPRTVFKRGATFKGTTVLTGPDDPRSGVIVAHGMRSAADMDFTDVRTGAILMKGAKIEGRVDLEGAEFGAVDLHGGEVGTLTITAAFQSNAIALELARVLQRPPDVLNTRDWLGDHPPIFLRGVARLSDLQVNGQLNGEGFRSEGVTILNDAKVEEVRFRQSHFGALDMRGVHVSTDVRMMGATLGDGLSSLAGEIGCAPREVMLFAIDFVDFSGAHIGRDLKLEAWQATANGSHKRTQLKAPTCMARMQVAGHVDISGIDAGALSFRATQIGQSLKLETSESGALTVRHLDLKDAAARTLVLGSNLRFPEMTDLADITLERIDSPEGPETIKAAMSKTTIAVRTVGYLAFERAFANSGDLLAARDVAHFREHAITEARPVWAKPFRWVANALSGHGLRPERTLFALLVASFVGMIVALQAPEARAFLARQNASPPARPSAQCERRAWIFFDAFFLSFDRLIPIISLNDEHKKIVFRAKRWTRVYFVVHGIFGMLLAATAIGVLGKGLGLNG